MLFSKRPRTPLRVLCIFAFDVRHRLNLSLPLSAERKRVLAALLDFGAYANALCDNKACDENGFREVETELEQLGAGPIARDYLCRLRELESKRPKVTDDRICFQRSAKYRERIVRLSLGTIAAISRNLASIDDGIRETYWETHLRLLFQIVMQCQIIDDVFDFRKDRAAGLPSFLTSVVPQNSAFNEAIRCSNRYAKGRGETRLGDSFAFRVARRAVWVLARITLAIGRFAHASLASQTVFGRSEASPG